MLIMHVVMHVVMLIMHVMMHGCTSHMVASGIAVADAV
jgi:hypothetical protein